MKIVVTGGLGFIGSHVVDSYVAAGHEVIIIDNLWDQGGGKLENQNPAARVFQLDIRSSEAARLIIEEKPQVLNLHAAQHSVKISTDDPFLDADVNIIGMLNLLEAAVKAGVRKVIFASSGATYGPPPVLPLDETSIQQPVSPYGITKLAMEHYLRYYQLEKNLAFTIFRYGNIYGPRQDPNGEAGVIAIFTKRILMGQPVRIDWNGQQEKDYLFVTDVAQANLLALDKGDNQIFCLGSGSGTSVNELYRRLNRLTGNAAQSYNAPKRPGDIFQAYFDCSKAARLLGWQPSVALEEGLNEVVAYFSRNL